jgi:heat shock protein HslJ
MTARPNAEIEGIRWRLRRGIAVPSDQVTTARFVGGTLTGQGPVNRYRAQYEFQDGHGIRIGPAYAMQTDGPPKAIAAQADYFFLLVSVETYAVAGDDLELRDSGGLAILSFDRAPSELIRLGGPWAIRAIRRSDGLVPIRVGSDAELTFDATAGEVSGSTGLNRLQSTVELHDGRFGLGPIRLTGISDERESEPEWMDEEADLLRDLEGVTVLEVNDGRLRLLNDDNDVLVELVRPGSL